MPLGELDERSLNRLFSRAFVELEEAEAQGNESRVASLRGLMMAIEREKILRSHGDISRREESASAASAEMSGMNHSQNENPNSVGRARWSLQDLVAFFHLIWSYCTLPTLTIRMDKSARHGPLFHAVVCLAVFVLCFLPKWRNPNDVIPRRG